MKKNLMYAVAAVAFVFSETSEAGFLRKNAEKSEEIKFENAQQEGEGMNPNPSETVPSSQQVNPSDNGIPAANPNPEAPAPAAMPNPEPVTPAAVTPNPGPRKPIVGDPLSAQVGNKEFHYSQVMEDAKMLPPQVLQSIPPEKLYTMLREQKIRQYLLGEHVKKLGLENSREFREELERARESLLIRLYIMRYIAIKAENEAALKARYVKYRAEYKSVKEYHLQHIMVSSEDAAKNIINELNGGKDFSELAKEKSEAPTKETGGDSGFVPVEILPPEIKSAVSPLKVGEYTKVPVKLGNGYNVFKVTEIRDSKPMTFEEAADMLRQLILREEMTKVLSDLEKKADVKRFHEDGSPIVTPIAA